MEPTSSIAPIASQPGTELYHRPHTTTVLFAAALLLFLLPFARINCADVRLMSNTGIGLAIGSDWKVEMGGNKLIEKLNREKMANGQAKRSISQGINFFLLIAIIAGLVGIATMFIPVTWKYITGFCAGLLACIMMIAFFIQYKTMMGSVFSKGMEASETKGDLTGLIGLKFTIWFFLSFLSFAAAAFFRFKQHQLMLREAMEAAVDFEFQHQSADQQH